MKLVVEFDRDADIIEVPESVVENREVLKKRFWKWISNKSIKHKYWTTFKDSYGRELQGLRYRSDAFVEWLNKKVLGKSEEKAFVVEEHVWDYSKDLPSIFF